MSFVAFLASINSFVIKERQEWEFTQLSELNPINLEMNFIISFMRKRLTKHILYSNLSMNITRNYSENERKNQDWDHIHKSTTNHRLSTLFVDFSKLSLSKAFFSIYNHSSYQQSRNICLVSLCNLSFIDKAIGAMERQQCHREINSFSVSWKVTS